MKEYRFLSPVGIFLAFVIAGCGGSGGDAQPPPPADTTPPVTTASPAGGLYNTQQQVTLTANEAATIYYSTDGNDPGVGAGNTTSGVSPVAAIPIPSGTIASEPLGDGIAVYDLVKGRSLTNDGELILMDQNFRNQRSRVVFR